MMGMHGEAWVNHAIQEADLLIACGMRFDDRVTGNLKTYAPQRARRSTSRSTRPRSTRTCAVDVALVGDLRDVLERLMPSVAPGDRERLAARTSTSSRATPRSATSSRCPTTAISTPRTSSTTSGARRAAATRSSSPTSASTRCGKRSTTTTTRRARSSPPAASARWASRVPAAIGAKRARPDAEVWAVVGDGGFQMTMCELATAVQDGIDIKVAIINNGYLGMVRQWQEFFYERRYAATPLVGPRLRQAGRGVRHPRHRRHARAATSLPAVAERAQPRRPGGRSISGSSRKTPSTRWCRPAPTCTR